MSRSRKQRDKSMSRFHGADEISAQHFSSSIGNDFNKGRRGMARSVKGAKKFIRSRLRFHSKQEMKRMLKEGNLDLDE